MRKLLISIIIVFISIFFINSKANFKYDVNYFTVDRHMEELINFESKDRNQYVHDYIYNEVSKYDVEVEENDEYILVNKKSNNANAKNIAFITHSNGLTSKDNVNNTALPVSSMLSSIRAYNNIETENNISFIFSKNDNLTLDGNVTFLNEHSKLVNNYDYLFSFDTRGMSGDLYIYSSSDKNQSIIDFYKSNVTSVSGSSDLSSIYDNSKFIHGEGLSFSTFENPQYFFSNTDTLKKLDENTINKYTNTVDELVKGAHTYNFDNNKSNVIYFNYFDNLIVISYLFIFVMFIISILAFVTYLFIFRTEFKIKNIILSSILSSSIIIFSIIISMFPLQELLDRFTKSPINSSNTAIIYAQNSLVFLVVIALTTFYGIVISKFVNSHYNFKFKDNIVSGIIIAIVINFASLIMTQKLNSIATIILILFIVMLYFTRFFKVSNIVMQYIFMFIVIPITTYNLYLMYIIATPARIIYFATLLGIYFAMILPTINVKSNDNII